MTPSELQHLRSVLAEAPEEIDIVHDVQCVYASTASEVFYEAARSAVPALIEECTRLTSALAEAERERDEARKALAAEAFASEQYAKSRDQYKADRDEWKEDHARLRAQVADLMRERDACRAGLADLLAATKDAEPTTSLTHYRSKARDLLKSGPGKEASDV